MRPGCFTRVCLGAVEVHCPAASDLRPEAVPPAEGSERGLHWRDRLLQSYSNGHQLSAGIHTDTDLLYNQCNFI